VHLRAGVAEGITRRCARLKVGQEFDRDSAAAEGLIEMQYERTEEDLISGKFRVRGGRWS